MYMSTYILTTAMDGIDLSVARRLGYICQSIYFYAMYLTGKTWPDSLFPDEWRLEIYLSDKLEPGSSKQIHPHYLEII
jgi:hypothetical protein